MLSVCRAKCRLYKRQHALYTQLRDWQTAPRGHRRTKGPDTATKAPSTTANSVLNEPSWPSRAEPVRKHAAHHAQRSLDVAACLRHVTNAAALPSGRSIDRRSAVACVRYKDGQIVYQTRHGSRTAWRRAGKLCPLPSPGPHPRHTGIFPGGG